MKKYKLVVSGGTFDKFHSGHKDFLLHQLSLSEHVLLGVSSDEFAQKKFNGSVIHQFDLYEDRIREIKKFLKEIGKEDDVRIEPIDSEYIPSIWLKEPIEAIVATQDTANGATAINHKRVENGQQPLPIEIFSITPADDGKPIASRRIRSGEIDREGKVYLSERGENQTYTLPESLRDELKKPFGELITNNNFDYESLPMQTVITVGDVATRTFVERKLIPHISVVDLIIERKKIFGRPDEIGFSGNEIMLSAENPAGIISPSLSKAVTNAFSYPAIKKIVIMVLGEEDLAVLPVLLRAPLGSNIFYGQPGEGIVRIDVTEERKKYAYSLLQQFKKD